MQSQLTKKKISARDKKSLAAAIIGAALIAISALACVLAKGAPEWAAKSFRPFSRAVCSVWSRIFSFVPFSLFELIICAMILAFIITLALLIFRWRKRLGPWAVRRYLAVILLIAGCHAAFFTFAWGLNYYASPLGELIGLEVREYSQQELYDTALYYLELANETAPLVPRNEDGTADLGTWEEMTKTAASEYSKQEAFDFGSVYIARPKTLVFWDLASRFNLSGIYWPFTAEANVNPDCSPASPYFSLCHELSHRLGITAEDEANFAAAMICRSSDNAAMRYSGCYMAFLYAYNSLAEVNLSKAYELWDMAGEYLKADIIAANKHVAKYAGGVGDKISEAVNDTYLKAMSQPSGVKSYGEVTDLLIAEYLKNR